MSGFKDQNPDTFLIYETIKRKEDEKMSTINFKIDYNSVITVTKNSLTLFYLISVVIIYKKMKDLLSFVEERILFFL